MIDILQNLIGSTETMVQAAIGVAAAMYVAGIWWRTKALVPTLAAVALAAVVVWAANNITFLQQQVGEATNTLTEPPSTMAPAAIAALRMTSPRGEPKAPPRGPRRPQPVRPASRSPR